MNWDLFMVCATVVISVSMVCDAWKHVSNVKDKRIKE